MRASGNHQIGHVRTGDEQDQRDEHRQRGQGAGIPSASGHASACGPQHDAVSRKTGNEVLGEVGEPLGTLLFHGLRYSTHSLGDGQQDVRPRLRIAQRGISRGVRFSFSDHALAPHARDPIALGWRQPVVPALPLRRYA
jgi:hypothetical protein